MVAATIDRVGATVLPQWAQPQRMAPMATTATTTAAITTITVSISVRSSTSIDEAEVQDGGLSPPSRFVQGANSSVPPSNCMTPERPPRGGFRDLGLRTDLQFLQQAR